MALERSDILHAIGVFRDLGNAAPTPVNTHGFNSFVRNGVGDYTAQCSENIAYPESTAEARAGANELVIAGAQITTQGVVRVLCYDTLGNAVDPVQLTVTVQQVQAGPPGDSALPPVPTPVAPGTPLSNANPVNVAKSAAGPGVSGAASRGDHKHDIDTAAPAVGIGAGNTEGTATTVARSDHNHALRETSGPTDLTIGAIADGQYVRRVGTTLVGGSPVTAPATSIRVTPEAPTNGPDLYFNGIDESLVFFSATAPRPISCNRAVVRMGTFNANSHFVVAIYQVPGGGAAGVAALLAFGDLLNPGAEANRSIPLDVTALVEEGTYFVAWGFYSTSVVPNPDGLIRVLGFYDVELFSANPALSLHPMTFSPANASAAPPATVDLAVQTQWVNVAAPQSGRIAPSMWLETV